MQQQQPATQQHLRPSLLKKGVPGSDSNTPVMTMSGTYCNPFWSGTYVPGGKPKQPYPFTDITEGAVPIFRCGGLFKHGQNFNVDPMLPPGSKGVIDTDISTIFPPRNQM